MISVTTCPACGHNSWNKHLSCVDHTVSHETFDITACITCNLLATNPRPEDSKLSDYYKSVDYISHTNKAASIIDQLYLLARTFTLRWKERLMRRYSKKPGRILDYGCGTGDFLAYCSNKQWRTTGIEPATSAREIAIAKTNTTIRPTINELSDENDYDVITMWHVLEHVSDPSSLLQKILSLLKKDGTLFIAVPNHKSFDGKYYQSYWAGYDVPRHLWHFNPDSMKNLLLRNGLLVKRIHPMKLDSYYVSLLSEKYVNNGKATFISLLKAFFLGLISNLKAINSGNYSSLIYVVKKNHE
jgi:SAM-dependent methyltransferase